MSSLRRRANAEYLQQATALGLHDPHTILLDTRTPDPPAPPEPLSEAQQLREEMRKREAEADRKIQDMAEQLKQGKLLLEEVTARQKAPEPEPQQNVWHEPAPAAPTGGWGNWADWAQGKTANEGNRQTMAQAPNGQNSFSWDDVQNLVQKGVAEAMQQTQQAQIAAQSEQIEATKWFRTNNQDLLHLEEEVSARVLMADPRIPFGTRVQLATASVRDSVARGHLSPVPPGRPAAQTAGQWGASAPVPANPWVVATPANTASPQGYGSGGQQNGSWQQQAPAPEVRHDPAFLANELQSWADERAAQKNAKRR